jgi:hypothetical protein
LGQCANEVIVPWRTLWEAEASAAALPSEGGAASTSALESIRG